MKSLESVDLSKIIETEDNTELSGEIACGGPNGCEIDIVVTDLKTEVATTNIDSED